MKEMEAKELRVGNLIYVDGNLRHVCGTCYKTIMHNYHPQNSVYSENYESECEPIPLTEEWLLKFGFEKELDLFYRKNKSSVIEIIFYDNGFLVANQSICLDHIQHAHQLQNLYFALTGTELEYNERK